MFGGQGIDVGGQKYVNHKILMVHIYFQDLIVPPFVTIWYASFLWLVVEHKWKSVYNLQRLVCNLRSFDECFLITVVYLCGTYILYNDMYMFVPNLYTFYSFKPYIWQFCAVTNFKCTYIMILPTLE